MTIYALSDPRSGAIRYVGRAADHEKRLKAHIHAPTSLAMQTWIAALAEDGLAPALSVLETCDDESADRRETYWILHFYETGALLNIAKTPNRRVTEETEPSPEAQAFLPGALASILPKLRLPDWAR